MPFPNSLFPMNLARLHGFLLELKRRHVTRVACAYAVVGFAIVEIANNFFPVLNIPAWAQTLVAALIVLGFPVAIVLAWAFEITPEGVKRSAPAKAEPIAPKSGGSWVYRTALLLLLSAGIVGWVAWRTRADVLSAAEPHATVAVLPFSIRAGAELEHLREGMVGLLGSSLDGAGNLRSTDPATTVKLAGEASEITPEIARDIAQRLGAGHFVIGTIYEIAGKVRIDASWYAVDGGRPKARETVEGELPELYDLINQISRALLAQRPLGRYSARLARMAGETATSTPALLAYLAGEEAYRRTDMAAAIEHFQQATKEDTTFALAYYRLATVYWWADPAITGVNRHHLSREAAERAYAHRQQLDGRDLELLEAFVALHRGAVDEAETRYHQILSDYPDDVEARFQYADLLHHWNPPRGRSLQEARAPFAQVLEADPDFACPI